MDCIVVYLVRPSLLHYAVLDAAHFLILLCCHSPLVVFKSISLGSFSQLYDVPSLYRSGLRIKKKEFVHAVHNTLC